MLYAEFNLLRRPRPIGWCLVVRLGYDHRTDSLAFIELERHDRRQPYQGPAARPHPWRFWLTPGRFVLPRVRRG